MEPIGLRAARMLESKSMNGKEILQEQYKDGSNLSARIRLHARFSTNRIGMFSWIFDQMKVPETARVLEVGTGTAQFWIRNAKRIPPRWRITVSDFSLGILKEGLADAAARGGRSFDAAQLDAQTLPFKDGVFDAIIANHMLYHVPDVPKALREFRRVLVPGGACYAATMGRANMREFNHAAQRFLGFPTSNSAERFGLETGLAPMRECFSTVEVLRYPDSLVATEAGPLMDWINSTRLRSKATPESIAALKNYFEAEISKHGEYRITKDAGMFIANA
ncbi:MAG TPA: class I SAM-dependent methyltransferase [Candidatus Binataceae bacterium]|nr:class I SAM-dependent methyltransferase [Candidatus Binataceae bacterium]